MPAGDLTGPRYPELVRVTDGTHKPVWSGESVAQILRGLGFEQFDGAVAKGIRLVDYSVGLLVPCPPEHEYWRFAEYEAMRFAYLPPGTFARGPQAAAVCPDGSVAGFSQAFETDYSSRIGASYMVGEPAVLHGSRAGAKYAGQIAGRGAVILAEEQPGFVQSQVALAMDSGVVVLGVTDMPLEEVLMIARGIACDVC